jgi:hypothetical protein
VSNILPTIRYLWLTLKHKVFVLRAGLKTRAPLWRLIIHDWSKFTPAEAPHCGRQFFGTKDDPEGFARAWLHHQNANPHHWEYWISRSGHDRAKHLSGALRMPMWAVREMVADWMGATRAYEGTWPEDWESWRWLRANLRSKVLPRVHSQTSQDILSVLVEVLGEPLVLEQGEPLLQGEPQNSDKRARDAGGARD